MEMSRVYRSGHTGRDDVRRTAVLMRIIVFPSRGEGMMERFDTCGGRWGCGGDIRDACR